jgi:cytochrome c-type biogenesis protein CcmE
MNSRLKRRLIAVTGVIVIVIVVVLAVVSATTAYKTVTVGQAASGSFNGSRVQVTGKVVDNSYSLDGDVLSFFIYDDASDTKGADIASVTKEKGNGDAIAEGVSAKEAVTGDTGAGTGTARPQLKVIYDKGFSATFGNQVEAICTGTIGSDGVLKCSELVTKCPSKYENSVDALTVSQLLSYGAQIIDKPVKLMGQLKAGTLATVGKGDRFVLIDASTADGAAVTTSDGSELPIRYEGALSDEIQDGTELILTGSLDASGRFEATDVALKG